jgi:hypothetical protein
VGLIGATRNSSIVPESRSRTNDSALSVTAMCCTTRARTAGAKKPMIDGAVGATFTVTAVVGDASTSGGMTSTSVSASICVST